MRCCCYLCSAPIYSAQRLQACHQSRFSSTVGSHSPSRASLRYTSSPGSTGTEFPGAARKAREAVARDEHIPVLGRALSDEVVGEQTFYPDAVCADCLGEIKIRHCRHHGRGGFFLARGNGEDSNNKGSEFDMIDVGKYFAARAGGHKPRRMVQNLSTLVHPARG
ncbi:hypothetical protein E4U57_002174 [Claviceps arundinis]|uniref:Uncharacterized protein n=1 Tax=Claviceps arundinis TaxID=1623583 RepID=A0ABQ7P944_9HYPO|nr:hypothetical protein E4U57_002174 [Claviceps arundinis]